MNHSTQFSFSRSLTGLAMLSASVFGLLAACSSSDNPAPSGPPVISTGGGGSGSGGKGSAGKASGDAGDGDQEPSGGTSSDGGGSARAGSANGGQGGGGEGGQPDPGGGEAGVGGEGGEAGSGAGGGPILPVCPSDDLGFLNRTTSSQKSVFDNVKRLGAHATLPPLN